MTKMRLVIMRMVREYAFLSNFYERAITYNGITYLNSEAAFQAQKTKTESEKLSFTNLSPRDAKALGRRVNLRNDWEVIKDRIMYEVVKAKFQQNPDLKDKLVATGNAEIVEGNYHHDRYWGVDLTTMQGCNKLGKICEKVREELGGWKRDYTDEDVGLFLIPVR